MKKTMMVFGVFIILAVGIFLWLLSGASPEHAPQDVKTIELDAP